MTYPGSASRYTKRPKRSVEAHPSAAHATTTLEDAQRLLPGTEAVTGEPQEIVKYDLSN